MAIVVKHLLFVKIALAGMLVSLSSGAWAEADPKLWPVVKEAFFAQRPIEDNVPFIVLTAPKRAESGAQVPFSIAVDQTQADANAIKKIYIIVDANPIQLAATYHLTEQLGKFNLSTRIRLETDSFVRAIGETADGKLYMSAIAIRAAGGCGGTIDNDEAAVRASAGKIKMNIEAPASFGSPTAATFIIKHPMRTGLQRDLVSQGFLPAFYIKKADFVYNKKPVMTVDFGVGTSEDPYLKFNFIPATAGTLEVQAVDNEGKSFSHQTELKS
ncbi:quinoprotein dehydrogenase-associated SoxYZ-like carrier [Methylobacillus flagellatus]|uniref:quinoprotein dehydrogenase-associated SoxYZ-like carrier n=1 Tax=Methylobacillus flagellatus TaxID=405 RepID=UPI0010F9B0F5|nr:quinoprotein dehydrogenase-associated SoxYZ-like carrier [Methylobacillus flagellatus]